MKLINKRFVLCLLIFSIGAICLTACISENKVENVESIETENTSVETTYTGKKYDIKVSDYKDIIHKYPKTGKSGEIIIIKTNEFMDVIPKIYINGEDMGNWNKNRTEYSFVMPDEDVEVTTMLKNATNE